MKQNRFFTLLLLIFLLAVPLSASSILMDSNSVVHGIATSMDGNWQVAGMVQEGGEHDGEESFVLFSTDFYWNKAETLLTFKQSGWGLPSVCTNYQRDSFIVYYPNWTPSHKDGGFYEFTKKNGRYSASNYNRTFIEYSEIGKLFSNKYGCYLIKLFGDYNPAGDDRNCKLYKLDFVDDKISLKTPNQMKDVELHYITWRNEKVNRDSPTFQDLAFITEQAIITLDADGKTWWHFNCSDESVKKFSSREEAIIYDQELNQLLNQEVQKNQNSSVFQFQLVYIMIIFLLLFVLICFYFYLQKIKTQAQSQKITYPSLEDISTKEKNRFIFNVQETERAKISRDIHDSVIQDIRVIRLETENLEVTEKSKEGQNRIQQIATDCIIKLRNICYNLTPVELINHSQNASSQIELVSIIQSLAHQFTARTHVPCSVGVAENFDYPVLEKEVTQNLFRVVQEALNNIEKHSYATKASVFINKKNSKLVIYINDDGIGCSIQSMEEKMKSNEHLGLRSMKDRIELLGGKIDFISSQDDGMEVRIELKI